MRGAVASGPAKKATLCGRGESFWYRTVTVPPTGASSDWALNSSGASAVVARSRGMPSDSSSDPPLAAGPPDPTGAAGDTTAAGACDGAPYAVLPEAQPAT